MADEQSRRFVQHPILQLAYTFMQRCVLAVEGTIVHERKLSFSAVAGLCKAKQALREAVVLPLKYPHLFTGNCCPWSRILLYGPPGTGISMLNEGNHSKSNGHAWDPIWEELSSEKVYPYRILQVKLALLKLLVERLLLLSTVYPVQTLFQAGWEKVKS